MMNPCAPSPPLRHTSRLAAKTPLQWRSSGRRDAKFVMQPPAPAAATDAATAGQSSSSQQQQPQPSMSAARRGSRDMSDTLTLSNIRGSLIRQEDTIIFALIERAQYARNVAVYVPEGVPVPGRDASGRPLSLLEYVLRETERLHGAVRRFTSPTEHAFYPADLPPLALPPLAYPQVLAAEAAAAVNVNGRVMAAYLADVLPAIAADGDDGNYGSAATLDVLALQALSTRIHYGKFVAEAKFRARPNDYAPLIRAGDADGLMDLLTDVPQERRVVERVRLKAAAFGRDIDAPPAAPAAAPAAAAAAGAGGGAGNNGQPAQQAPPQSQGSEDEAAAAPPRYKVSPDAIAALYDDVVMPMTKDVQVAYLLRRLDGGGADWPDGVMQGGGGGGGK